MCLAHEGLVKQQSEWPCCYQTRAIVHSFLNSKFKLKFQKFVGITQFITMFQPCLNRFSSWRLGHDQVTANFVCMPAIGFDPSPFWSAVRENCMAHLQGLLVAVALNSQQHLKGKGNRFADCRVCVCVSCSCRLLYPDAHHGAGGGGYHWELWQGYSYPHPSYHSWNC